MGKLQCQGAEPKCAGEVTHVDNKGFVYCVHHGVGRRNSHPCRKLLKREIRLLEAGEPIWWDARRNKS